MKEFKSKGIWKYGGGRTYEKKKWRGTPGKAYNQTIVLTEDLVWELRTFAADHRYRGANTVIEATIGCFSGRTGHWTLQAGTVLERICKEVKFYITCW